MGQGSKIKHVALQSVRARCGGGNKFTSQKVFTEKFCKSQFPHKIVNLSFIIASTKNKSTVFVQGLTFAKRLY